MLALCILLPILSLLLCLCAWAGSALLKHLVIGPITKSDWMFYLVNISEVNCGSECISQVGYSWSLSLSSGSLHHYLLRPTGHCLATVVEMHLFADSLFQMISKMQELKHGRTVCLASCWLYPLPQGH